MNITIDSEHIYRVDGVIVPYNVTGVLEAVGITDFSKVPPHILKRAADFGKKCHYACQLHDEKNLDYDSLDGNLKPYLESWKQASAMLKVKEWECIETKLYSKFYGFIGTVDRIAKRADNTYICIDIKTSTQISKSVGLQLGAYAGAWEEMQRAKALKIKISERFVVKLTPGTPEIKPFKGSADYNEFLACLAVAKMKVRMGIIKDATSQELEYL